LTTADDFVLQLALERGLVAAEALESARRASAEHADLTTAPASVLESLHASGALDRRALAEALAQHLGMPFVVIGDRHIPGDVLGTLPRSFVMRHGVCAVAFADGAVQVAVADPLDVDALDGLAHVCAQPVTPVVAASDDLRRAITRHYGDETDEMEDLTGGNDRTNATDITVSASDATTKDSDAPIIRLVHSIIHEAVRRRASDIHLEPLERRFRVRYRIDGVLVEVDSPAKRLQLALISRVKIMANISIAEKRVPQDGRIQIVLAGKRLDLRVSSLPTAHGESVVMRILDKEGLRLGFLRR
jgi:general secretion pathway protein E/type IV pilus assembly protein PilB